MSPFKLTLGFTPVVLFTLVVQVAGSSWVPIAALVGFALAVGLVLHARSRGEAPKVMTLVAGAVVAAYGVIALVAHGSEHFLAGYGRALAALALAVVVFASVPVRPFTEQYAREEVSPQVAASPGFRQFHRRLSLLWAGAVLGLAVGHGLATALADQLNRPEELLLSWGLPVVLLLGALRATNRLTAEARDRTHAAAA